MVDSWCWRKYFPKIQCSDSKTRSRGTRKCKFNSSGLMLAIAVCGRLRQGNCYECEASLGYSKFQANLGHRV